MYIHTYIYIYIFINTHRYIDIYIIPGIDHLNMMFVGEGWP
jgi:hypothetical protein